MVVMRRFAVSICSSGARVVSLFSRYSSKIWPYLNRNDGASYQSILGGRCDVSFRNHLGVRNSSSFWQDRQQFDVRQIEVVDSDTWSVSSCLAHVSNGSQEASQLRLLDLEEVGDGVAHNSTQIKSDADIYDVEDMRIRGSLYYKVEKSSLEFDEYEFEFRGKKSKSQNRDKRGSKNREHQRCDVTRNAQTSLNGKEGHQEITKKINLNLEPLVNKERLAKIIEEKYVVCALDDPSCSGKKERTPTFNQLTGPYHEPFCLDIFVSKGSVRACVIHRATSKVVIVAHSISKDMKFELVGSTKSVAAATAVGKLLANRALEDDIHDVIYTPRKGDKLEGKLQVVFQSILDNGLNVKLKLKQRNPGKAIGRT